MKNESGEDKQVFGEEIDDGRLSDRARDWISFVHKDPDAWISTGSRVSELGSEGQE